LLDLFSYKALPNLQAIEGVRPHMLATFSENININTEQNIMKMFPYLSISDTKHDSVRSKMSKMRFIFYFGFQKFPGRPPEPTKHKLSVECYAKKKLKNVFCHF